MIDLAEKIHADQAAQQNAEELAERFALLLGSWRSFGKQNPRIFGKLVSSRTRLK
jgi:hypothetical protein